MSKHWTEEVADAFEGIVDRDEWVKDGGVLYHFYSADMPEWQVSESGGMTLELGSFQLTTDLIDGNYAKTARACLAALAAFEGAE